jgi:hypothetical protein
MTFGFSPHLVSDTDDGHEKFLKKDLLIGKRGKEKDKKGKDKGYAALGGESSGEEEPDSR